MAALTWHFLGQCKLQFAYAKFELIFGVFYSNHILVANSGEMSFFNVSLT